MDEKTITFNDIPQAMNYLITKMNDLEEMIRTSAVKQPDHNEWFNLEELCDYLPDRPAKQTVYSWVNQKKIPYHKKGKKLQFLKCEIDEWLHTDETQQEIIANPRFTNQQKKEEDHEKKKNTTPILYEWADWLDSQDVMQKFHTLSVRCRAGGPIRFCPTLASAERSTIGSLTFFSSSRKITMAPGSHCYRSSMIAM